MRKIPTQPNKQVDDQPLTPEAIVQRRDAAVRRALNTPPKPYKDAKIGKPKRSDPSAKR